MLERDGRLVGDRVEELPVVVGERRVAVDDELADRPARASGAAAAPRARPRGPRARRCARPRGRPRPPSRGATRLSSARSPRATPRDRATPRPPPRSGRAPRARRPAAAPARRASRARSTAPTCEAIDVSSAISASVNARGSRVRTLSAPSSTSRARIGTARIDSYWSSRRFGNALKRGSRCARSAIMIGSRSAAATPVIPSPRRMRGALVSSSTPVAVRRPEDELVGPLVVEVDEARVRLERGRDLVRDRLEHLLEVERGVDDLGRAGQEREVPGGVVHCGVSGPPVRQASAAGGRLCRPGGQARFTMRDVKGGGSRGNHGFPRVARPPSCGSGARGGVPPRSSQVIVPGACCDVGHQSSVVRTTAPRMGTATVSVKLNQPTTTNRRRVAGAVGSASRSSRCRRGPRT